MHFHQRHDDPCDDDHGWPDHVHALFATLNRMETAMTEAQNQLDGDVQKIADALTGIASDIASLQSQLSSQVPPSVDLSGLDAIAQRASDLAASVAPAPAPEPTPAPEPAPAPAAPVVDPNAPAQPAV